MSGDIARSAVCYCATVNMGGEDKLAAFFSYLPLMGHRGKRRGHRTVVLPDFQGLGIGNSLIEFVAEKMHVEEGLIFTATTSALGIIYHRQKRPDMWICTGVPRMTSPSKSGVKTAAGRLTTSWRYIPKSLRKES